VVTKQHQPIVSPEDGTVHYESGHTKSALSVRLLDGGYMFITSRGIIKFSLESGSRHRALGGSPDAFLAVDSRHFLFGEHRREQRLTKLSNTT
jgi:hypothetical protein